MTRGKDTLGDTLTTIERGIRERGLAVFHAWVEIAKGTSVVHWDVEDDDAESWRGYLDQAKATGAAGVAVSAERLTAEELEEEGNGVVKGADEARPYIGHVGIIQLCWFTATCPGVAFRWDRSTQWFEAFYGASEDAGTGHRAERVDLSDGQIAQLADHLAANAEFQRVAEQPDGEAVAARALPPPVTMDKWGLRSVVYRAAELVKTQLAATPEVEMLAKQLAVDPKFRRATNRMQREYAAEKVLPREVMEHRTKLAVVIQRATTIAVVDR